MNTRHASPVLARAACRCWIIRAQRAALIAGTWTEDAAYLDHLMSGNSAAEIDAMIEGAEIV